MTRGSSGPGGWRARLLPGVLAGAMLAPVLGAGPAVAQTQAQIPMAVTSDPVADGSISEEDKALQDAQSTGKEVELVSARTETSDTWAQPTGSFKVREHGTPVRLLRDGSWVATDPTLAFATDGSVVTKATSVAIKLSGGGTAPLLSGAVDGRSISLTWPKTLPKPTLSANVATYAEVLPGVDLLLKAEVEGFSQLFVVKNAEAAKNPELATLQFGISTVGLTVNKDSQSGSLTATDPAGQIIFSSAAPLMWDSTTTGTPAPQLASFSTATETGTPAEVFDPAAGAQDALMPTSLSGNSLTITPDQQLLTGPETTYPVYIDPTWGYGDRQKWSWTRVYKHHEDITYWNSKDVLRVGYESESGGSDRISRSFLQVDTGDLSGAQIKSATLRLKNTWSWSCEDRPIELYPTNPITSKTNWTNQPDKLTTTALSTVDDSKGWSSSLCPAGNLEFDATSWVRQSAAAGKNKVTFGLYAEDETDTFGWKKFDPKTVVLETVYNHPPETPQNLGTVPVSQCSTGAVIGNTTVSLRALISDQDAGILTAQFQLYEKQGTTSTLKLDQSVSALKDRYATLVVPVDKTPGGAGVTYTWKVRAKDSDGAYSAWKDAPCSFAVDRTRPSAAPKITSQLGGDGQPLYPPGDNGWPTQTGPARADTRFLFDPNGVTDVESYFWWTDTDPDIKETVPGAPWADLRVPSYGPHLIYAYSVDKASNRSDTATYLYYATRSPERDKPGDLNGDGFKDIWSVDSNGTLLTYAGRGAGEFSAATNGTAGTITFPNNQTTFSGDWQGGGGYNDLLALEPDDTTAGKPKRLVVYENTGTGTINPDSRKPLEVWCPAANQEVNCTGEAGWSGRDHWHDAQQIVTGDFNNDSRPDLLVKQGSQLWFYKGNRTVKLSTGIAPTLVGGNDWDKFTIIAPGDINKDAVPDLLLRDNATGDLFRSHGSKDATTVVNFATWGSARTKIGSGFTEATYPHIGISGDLHGDGIPNSGTEGDGIVDLWARKADNTMVGWPGVGIPDLLSSFGTQFTIDGITGGSRMVAGTKLTSGQSVASRTATLTMGPDGYLVLKSKSGKTLWSSTGTTQPDAFARVEADGNLSVYSPDGTNKLWSTNLTQQTTPGLTGEGYAFVQDRGNLVVYNSQSQSLWSTGTATRNDVNGDGRSDMVEWYDYADGHDALHVLDGASDGGIAAPHTAYASTGNNWTASLTKKVHGDFNGDGIGDVALMYYYPDYSHRLWTFLGAGNGTYQSPFSSWYSTGNRWGAISRSTLQAGDFNGDGRDDIAAWYDYSDGRDTLFTFTSDVRGGFNNPFASWTSNTWSRSMTKLTTGDFNGDGRDDIAGLYDYAAGAVKLWHFQGQATGGFAAPTVAWSHDTWGDWDRTHVQAGDFNKDGKDDVATWFDYPDGTDKIHTYVSLSNGNGTFAPPKQAWSVPAGTITYASMQLVPGDYNGDGIDDLGAMYNKNDGTVRMFTWLANPDATFQPIKTSWTDSWDYNRTKFINRYTT